jgi:hypothetical protein
MSSSPLTSLSRTPAHEASLVGTILTPYFLSKPSTEAITTLAQSVSGMKPILTSSFSGLSEPWAHACRVGVVLAAAPKAAADAACSRRRRESPGASRLRDMKTEARCIGVDSWWICAPGKQQGARSRARCAARPPDAFVPNRRRFSTTSLARFAVEPQVRFCKRCANPDRSTSR